MLKKAANLTVAITMLVLTGCDPGSNKFTKRSQPAAETQSAQLTSRTAKELK